MEDKEVRIFDVDWKEHELSDYEGVGGVWAAFDSDGKCWNVAETKDIAKEMREDMSYMRSMENIKPYLKYHAINHFGKPMFDCPLNSDVREYSWSKVYSNCKDKTVFFVVFIELSNEKDKDNFDKKNLEIRARREKIEKYIAYMTTAEYWRDRGYYKTPEKKEKGVENFINSFNDKIIKKKIDNFLNVLSNSDFLQSKLQ